MNQIVRSCAVALGMAGRSATLAFSFLLSACGASSDGGDSKSENTGAETGPCYPNGTCNDGLSCLSNVCVHQENTGGTGGMSAGTGGMSAGSGGTDAGTGGMSAGSGGTSADGGQPEPVCDTVDVVNSTAGEKTNAAFCFGLVFPDSYSCVFDSATNTTFCDGAQTDYYVQWTGNEYGDAYNASNSQFLGTLAQGTSGQYTLDFANGAYGECVVSGDVATICVLPP